MSEPSEELVERVARLIFDRHSGKCAQDGKGWKAMANEWERNAYRATARAAISAMQSHPIPIYKTSLDPNPTKGIGVRDVPEE